jgi:phospholipid transport system transporter-binding protein
MAEPGLRLEGTQIVLDGDLNFDTVPPLLEPGLAFVRSGAQSVDFTGVGATDSAAVALSLAFVREAQSYDRNLAFTNLPSSVKNLAKLYGLADLFPPA